MQQQQHSRGLVALSVTGIVLAAAILAGPAVVSEFAHAVSQAQM